MAEIRVERKKTSLWPWILGIILLALVIWGIAQMMGKSDDNPQTNSSALRPAPVEIFAVPALAPLAEAA